MTPPFAWRIHRGPRGWSVLVLSGEMSLVSRPLMRTAFDALLETAGGPAAVDFADVRLLSSAALGELARCRRLLEEHGRDFCILCPAGDVLEVLEIADMHRIVPIYPDIETLLLERPPS